MISRCLLFFFFFFNDTATTEIYTLSLHDALPIYPKINRVEEYNLGKNRQMVDQYVLLGFGTKGENIQKGYLVSVVGEEDRKSTRLNSSHGYISYAVFCLKKKKKTT